MALLRPVSFKRRGRLLVLLVVVVLCIVSLHPMAPGWNFSFKHLLPLGLFWGDAQGDVLRFVDPLIGTVNGGHVFPGASLPYGMAKASPDSDSPGENAAGFVSDYAPITGFSHLHDSGTGGAASMGNFPIMAHPGCPDDDFRACKYTVQDRITMRINGSAEASPGYFAINLTNSIRAEMTTSHRTALYRFTFPTAANITTYQYEYHYVPEMIINETAVTVPNRPLILIDLADIAMTRTLSGVQVYNTTGRIIGEGTFAPSFGTGKYEAYFCLDFRGGTIRDTGTFVSSKAVNKPKYQVNPIKDFQNPSGAAGAWVQFEHADPRTQQILARVGLSFMSVDRACANAEAEIPDFDFAGTVAAARAAWRDKLAAVEVDSTGVSVELRKVFWSGLYRSMLSPQNYTGENPVWNSTEPYFDSFYCIWDSFRAQHPLLTILDPEAQRQMIRTLVDVFVHVGKLPDCRMQFSKGYTQGGSNADVVIAEAYIKNITEGINWHTAYEAVVSDAEVAPVDFSVEGRGNLQSWHAYHYIAHDHTDNEANGPHSRSVSRTLEYAYDDFCISRLATALGRPADARKYHGRSGYWRNVWNPDQRDIYRDAVGDLRASKFKGFMMPRSMNGTFKYQNTRTCTPGHDPHLCYFDTAQSTYEGSPWLYSFYVPQDMAGLIELMGGREAFVERLDFYHKSGIVYMGNEQSFLTVFQFHYGGRPGVSSRWVREYIPGQFNASVNGIPGNDDCAMGAFSGLAMMGFFPVAGQSVYLLIPPFFPEVRLRSRGERPAVIRKVLLEEAAENEDRGLRRAKGRIEKRGKKRKSKSEDEEEEEDVEEDKFKDAIYIQSATLDGKPYTKNWIDHEFFLKGGVLELVVGKEEGDWGTREVDLPPSWPAVTPTT